MTLFISDLDGTLLNETARLNQASIDSLNQAIRNGALFTVATARSAATAAGILAPLELNLPAILMNGTFLFDTQKHTYVLKNQIAPSIVTTLLDVCDQLHIHGFMFSLEEDLLVVYHNKLTNPSEQDYFTARRNKPLKKFVQTDTLHAFAGKNIVYFSFIDRFEALLPIKEYVETLPGVNHVFYKDVYADAYYLEIFSQAASKSQTALTLKERTGADKIVAFGDNLNDRTLLSIADTAVAVSNAVPEIRTMADVVLDNRNFDAVSKYVLENSALV